MLPGNRYMVVDEAVSKRVKIMFYLLSDLALGLDSIYFCKTPDFYCYKCMNVTALKCVPFLIQGTLRKISTIKTKHPCLFSIKAIIGSKRAGGRVFSDFGRGGVEKRRGH